MMLKSSKTNDFSNTILFSNTVKPVQTTTNFSPQMKKKTKLSRTTTTNLYTAKKGKQT